MVENKYVNRVIVTDGKFLYNCATKRILKNDIVKTDIFDVILFGILSKKESITLPEYLCGHKVQCSSVKPYEKGKEFPEYINGYSFIPTRINKKSSFYDVEKYYYAESKYFTLSNINCTKEYIFPKSIHLVNDVLSCNKKVEKIHFNNITSYIPPSCFCNCTSLKEIQLPYNLKIICTNAFQNCTSLKNITLPNSLTKISSGAFHCSGLEYIIIPKNIKVINKKTFMNCHNLHTVVLGTNTERIYPNAFTNCNFYFPKYKINFKKCFCILQ